MDDLLTEAKNMMEAIELKRELIQLTKRGQFNIRKWNYNCLELREITGANNDIQLNTDHRNKILGIWWNPEQDTINYKFTPSRRQNRITKRIILSQIAQLYDPLGLLGPVIIKAKLLMQQLWMEKLDWDESVPQALHTSCIEIQTSLPLLQGFIVNRRITVNNQEQLQMHGFCDASEKAYGACLYMRTKTIQGDVSVQLICAKSRVAPLKKISLPKLELCAAMLLTNLYITTIEALKLKVGEVYLWSDSTIVLSWVNSEPFELKTFVANRVSAIQSKANREYWKHVRTQDNPADIISRGLLPAELVKNKL